jgi:uroporphyrinogen III methyltransferase/synthase
MMGVVVITRPVQQTEGLVKAVREAGFAPVVFPAIAIGPAPNPERLAAVLARLWDFRMVIFVSPNAIEGALSALGRAWPTTLPVAVMGPGSVAALARHGIVSPQYPVVSPGRLSESEDLRFDSETLYAELDLEALRPGPILLVKGNGGRPWLADQLSSAGLVVETVESYARSLPRPTPSELAVLEKLVLGQHSAQLIVTSSESLGNILRICQDAFGRGGPDWVRCQRVIVPHARIAENATALGFADVVLSGTGDENIVRALK